MTDLDKVIKSANNTRVGIGIEKLCKITKYLDVEEKIKFTEDYKKTLKNCIEKYKGYEMFIAIVLFDLKVVEYYTDIDLQINFKEYDLLQKNGLIDKIIEFIGYDYTMLSNIVLNQK